MHQEADDAAIAPDKLRRPSSTRSPGRTTSGGPIPSMSTEVHRQGARASSGPARRRHARRAARPRRRASCCSTASRAPARRISSARCAPARIATGKAYFGYAQMTPDVANYADYYLRRLVHSLEKPYDPDRERRERPGAPDQPARRRRRGAAAEATSTSCAKRRSTRTSSPRLVLQLADEIVASPKFARPGARHQHRARAALSAARAIRASTSASASISTAASSTPLAHQAVAALDPNTGEDRAFEIIDSLGKLMWTVERAALVFCHRSGRGSALLRRRRGALPEGGARSHPDRQPAAERRSSSSPASRTSTARCAACSPSPTSTASRRRAPSRCSRAARPRKRASSSPSGSSTRPRRAAAA